MGIYDQYRQANSQAVSQFAGSIVPEVAKASTEAAANFNAAADMDDKLNEALGNLQHLNSEADTQYANELKEKYMARLKERSERSDYENLGRRTRRDAMQFSQEYLPLVQRQQAMSEMVKKVTEDKDIFDDRTKAQIIQWQKDMNAGQKDEKGNYVRDEQGRIKLGAVQPLPYAKDVNIQEKLQKFVSDIETKLIHGPYVTKDGFRISEVSELRSPETIARITKQLIAADPEITAMLNRDLVLNTYKRTAKDFKAYAERPENNKSLYQELKAANISEADIKAMAERQGKTVEELKLSPVQEYKKRAAATGKTEEDAYRSLYMDNLKNELIRPSLLALADTYKIDRIKDLDVRNDPEYDAQIKAKYDAESAKQSSVHMMETTGFDVNNYKKPTKDLEKEVKGMEGSINTTLARINGLVAEALGEPPLKSGFTREQRDRYLSIVNNPAKRDQAVEILRKAGKIETAAALEDHIKRYRAGLEALEIKKDVLNTRKVNPNATSTAYTVMVDAKATGTVKKISEELSEMVNMGSFDGTLTDGSGAFNAFLEDEFGDVQERRNNKKFAKVDFTTSSIGGKPVVQITLPDGKVKAVVANNIPPAMMSEFYVSAIKSAAANKSADYKREVENKGYMALGEQSLQGTTRTEMAMWEPSSIPHPVGDGFKVKVSKKGESKLYTLIFDGPNGSIKSPNPTTNPADILIELGRVKYNQITQ